MAVKTFTTGEVLTAADTNTYLNNGGLVYITRATATTATSIQINNCFTSEFDNYRIEWKVTAATSVTQQLLLRLSVSGSPSATGYDTRGWYVTFGGSSGATARFTTEFGLGGADSSNATGGQFELQGPATTKWTTGQAFFSNYDAIVTQGGRHAVNTAYDGAYIFVASGNFTATFDIYGYRKP